MSTIISFKATDEDDLVSEELRIAIQFGEPIVESAASEETATTDDGSTSEAAPEEDTTVTSDPEDNKTDQTASTFQ